MRDSLAFWSRAGVVERVIQEIVEYAIFCTDQKGNVMTWNSGAERIFGHRQMEMLGRPVEVIFTPEDREEGMPEMEMVTAVEEGRAADERFHIRKNGERFWASGVLISVRDELEQLMGFVKIIRDRADQKVVGQSIQMPLEPDA